MSNAVFDIHGVRIMECAVDGPQMRGPGDAADLIGLAWEQQVQMVACRPSAWARTSWCCPPAWPAR